MKKKIIWIFIFLVVASILFYKITSGGQALTVEIAKVTRGDIVEYIEETGEVMPDRETEIYSTSAGKVIQVLKEAGDTVKAGDLLARIDNTDLLLQIKALKAQKLAASAKYEEIKSSADEAEIRRLSIKLSAYEALYEEAKRTADNNKILYESGAISLDTLKSSITKLATAEADLETARSILAEAQKGVSLYVKKQYEAQLSEIQARIEQLEKKSEEMIVKAPVDGLVMIAEIEKGSIVQMGSKLFEIGSSKGFYLKSDVLVEDISGVNLGSSVIIENEDLGIKEIRGTVRKIYPKAESKMSDLGIEQKRIRVDIGIDNMDKELRPGYDMTVNIVKQSKKDTLLISEKAIFEYQGKDYVFVNESGTARLRAIEKGIESNDQVEVLGGLKEGEEVVLTPDETLEEGTKIKIKEA